MVVVVSVVYLAAQLRQSNRLGEAAAIREWYAEFRAIFNAWGESEDKTKIIMRGISDFESLRDEDKAVFHTALASFLNHAQMTQDLYAKGMIPKDLADIMDSIAVSLIKSPGGNQFWEIIKPGYRGSERLDEIAASDKGELPPWDEHLPWWSGRNLK
jgi:hypothetical protein